MKNEKSITWTGKNGNTIEIRAYYNSTMIEEVINYDGYEIATGKKIESIDADLVLIVDGKKIDSCWDVNFWRVIDLDNGLRKIWGLKVAMMPEQAALVEKFLAEVIESGKAPEVKAEEEKVEEAKDADKIESAKATIAKAEKQNWIPTNAEYRRWAINYNNVANEGGEGYVPEYVTTEELARAKKILGI